MAYTLVGIYLSIYSIESDIFLLRKSWQMIQFWVKVTHCASPTRYLHDTYRTTHSQVQVRWGTELKWTLKIQKELPTTKL